MLNNKKNDIQSTLLIPTLDTTTKIGIMMTGDYVGTLNLILQETYILDIC